MLCEVTWPASDRAGFKPNPILYPVPQHEQGEIRLSLKVSVYRAVK